MTDTREDKATRGRGLTPGHWIWIATIAVAVLGGVLRAPVDLAGRERDDALAAGRPRGLAPRVDGRREPADEQPVILAGTLGVGLRGADADPQLPRVAVDRVGMRWRVLR